MARQTNWLDTWKPYNFKGLRKSELNEKKTEIKDKVKAKLKASDKKTGEQHSITFIWRKLSAPGFFKLVAHLTPPEKRDDGGTGSVISPKVPPQP